MVKKKKLTREELFKVSMDKKYENSPIVAEKYPNIKSLTIKMTFFDDSGNVKVDERTWNVTIDTARAFFYEECPNGECVNGGFDLTEFVDLTTKKRDAYFKSHLFCQGWQDRERIDHFHCLTKLDYEIFVEYF